jgi:DNA polymerase III delta prime subunit
LAPPKFREARRVGPDDRPRDWGCAELGLCVEFQHSPIASEEFDARNSTVPARSTWIFDATEVPLYAYNGIFFCTDTFRERYSTSEKVHVLFHCSDGQLRQAACDAPAKVAGPMGTMYVRFLEAPERRAIGVVDAFCDGSRPADKAYDCAPGELTSTIRVLSVEGRELIDKVHRDLFRRFPSQPLTVFNGPPGAGKTTLLREVCREWKKARPGLRILVVTFNRANQELLQRELTDGLGQPYAYVRTLDSLCFSKCRGRANFKAEMNDSVLMKACFPDEVKGGWSMVNKLNAGGKGSSALVSLAMKNPRAGASFICKKHRRLTQKKCNADWTGTLQSYPASQLVQDASTFSARRYLCDRDNLLAEELGCYQVVLVDEMQDLLSAQEQRLIQQASCPVVMLGDMAQQINSFKDRHDGRGCDPLSPCTFVLETPFAPQELVEWYGTYRLDPQTVAYIEDRTGKRMFSNRRGSTACIRWQTALQHPACTLIMARANSSVIELAEEFTCRVVDGAAIANSLERARRDMGKTEPLSEYAQSLSKGVFDRRVELLKERHVDLKDVEKSGCTAACTVHRAKGYESTHCAVHADVLACADSEPEILFVAMTRHRESLTILREWRPTGPATAVAQAQA